MVCRGSLRRSIAGLRSVLTFLQMRLSESLEAQVIYFRLTHTTAPGQQRKHAPELDTRQFPRISFNFYAFMVESTVFDDHVRFMTSQMGTRPSFLALFLLGSKFGNTVWLAERFNSLCREVSPGSCLSRVARLIHGWIGLAWNL